MKHIEYYSFTKQEMNALKKIMESIWTAGPLDLQIITSDKYSEEKKLRATRRLNNLLGLAMGVTAWLVPQTLNPKHYRYNDFRQAFSLIEERLASHGVDVQALLDDAQNHEP